MDALALDGTQVSVAAIGAFALIVGAALTYAGILASRENKRQSATVNTAVAEVEQEITEGRTEYEARGRIIDALQRDLAVLETRAKRLENRADDADERAEKHRDAELRCLESLEFLMQRIAVLEAHEGIGPTDE